MGPIGCPETSVRNYHYLLHNNPKDHASLHTHTHTHTHSYMSVCYLPTSVSVMVTALATAATTFSAGMIGARSSWSVTVSTVAVIICKYNKYLLHLYMSQHCNCRSLHLTENHNKINLNLVAISLPMAPHHVVGNTLHTEEKCTPIWSTYNFQMCRQCPCA